MPENGNAMPRVSSSGPQTRGEERWCNRYLSRARPRTHYHFKLVSLCTQACARQLRAAKKTRENNLNILSRWWQTRKRGRIMSRAFSPFPTIPTTMKTIKQNFRTIVQFYFSIPPFLIQKRILSIHNYVTRITTSEKIYSLYFSKESNELSNVTRKP